MQKPAHLEHGNQQSSQRRHGNAREVQALTVAGV